MNTGARKPLFTDPNLRDDEYADLRLWVNRVVIVGGKVAPGYAAENKWGRVAEAVRNGRKIGQFVQFRKGTYAATGLPRYDYEGHGWVEMTS